MAAAQTEMERMNEFDMWQAPIETDIPICWACKATGHRMTAHNVLHDIGIETDANDESEHEATCENFMSPLASDELACMSMKLSFADDPAVLNLKEILMADTAATVDSVNDPEGMTNLKESSGKGIIVGNSAAKKAASIGIMPGTCCNKHGEAQITGTI